MARGAALVLLVVALCVSSAAHSLGHPRLLLTGDGVAQIRANLGRAPLFDRSLARAVDEVESELARGIDVPVPRDFSGGYTHERHKQNFFVAQKAGVLFQILDEPRYATYVRDMLLRYAELYPTLPLHPRERSYARGRLFWQCLNDANWLLYMAQAYDAVYDFLTPEERDILEEDLFRPFADFISIENPQFFNRIHNHSAWGNAAVGMIGIAMGDDALIARALHGTEDELEDGSRDNDGGLITTVGQGRGFLANLDAPFSPDGYYTEGPYYQRYAMYPFLAFSLALENAYPDRDALGYKDGVLIKAVYALLNLADYRGHFFPINDAQKGMSIANGSLVTAVDAAYFYGGRDPGLLSVAREQGQVALDQTGMAVALAVQGGLSKPFPKRSVVLRDGADGEQGGVAVLRDSQSPLELVFKFSAHGLSHGHYDKLGIALYDAGREVLQDYGLVRFVNVEQKGGGNYLPENATWAKQTIAHNTLVIDTRTQFDGSFEASSAHHPVLRFHDLGVDAMQVISARESNAYPGSTMQRTVALLRSPEQNTIALDILRVGSDEPRRYDLPFHFLGQLINAGFALDTDSAPQVLGDGDGYQHLWLEAAGRPTGDSLQFTWLHEGRFNTITSAVNERDQLLLARLGANDPDFNLRRDPVLIIRREARGRTVFASTVEPHGRYDPVTESAIGASGEVQRVSVLDNSPGYTAIAINWRGGERSLLLHAVNGSSGNETHELNVEGVMHRWSGPYLWVKSI